MAKRKTLVRWQDGLYDRHLEKCEGCTGNHYESEQEQYKEVISNKGYHEWLMGNQRAGDNVDDSGDYFEPLRANPDKLIEGDDSFWTGGEAYPPSQLAQLEAAVATLTEQQRAVWDLVYVQGKSHEDAAATLKIKQPAVSRCAARALARVKKFMGAK